MHDCHLYYSVVELLGNLCAKSDAAIDLLELVLSLEDFSCPDLTWFTVQDEDLGGTPIESLEKGNVQAVFDAFREHLSVSV